MADNRAISDSCKDERKKSLNKDLSKEEHKKTLDMDLRKEEHKKSADKDLNKEEHKQSPKNDLHKEENKKRPGRDHSSERDRRRHSRSPERYRSQSRDRETTGSKCVTGNDHHHGVRSQSRSSDIEARTLFVGNIFFDVTEDVIMDFYNGQMKIYNLSQAEGNPIIRCHMHHAKTSSIIEFRSVGETTQALALDGIICQGQTLTLKRPRYYQTLPGMTETPKVIVPGVVSSQVQDSPHKIFIGGLPFTMNEENIQEFLTPFGPLKAFHLVRDNSTGKSKGFAFCCYADTNITDQACAGLNGMQLGDMKLEMQRANVGAKGRASESKVPVPVMAETPNIVVPGVVSNNVQDSPHKIFIGNLPCTMNEKEIQELLTSFGPLKAFHLVKTSFTGNSKGFAFCCYEDPNITDQACAFLNGMQLGNMKLVMRRASVGAKDRASESKVPVPVMAETPNIVVPGVVSNNVQDSPHKIFISNLPCTINEKEIQELLTFFGPLKAFHLVRDNSTGQSKGFAFCCYADTNITDQACAGLNGIQLGDMKIIMQRANVGAKGRASESKVPLPVIAVTPNVVVPGVSSYVEDSPHKIFIGNLPDYLNEDQIQDLFTLCGPLQAFHLVRDSSTGQSKGFAFCCFVDPNITDQACAHLNGMQLGDRKLVMQRASVGAKSRALRSQLPVNSQIPRLNVNNVQSVAAATVVLCLMNMVTAKDLEDEDEYEDIYLDVKVECRKYGIVKSIEIPRGIKGVQVPGVGKIFVEFNNSQECQRAQQALSGRKFAGREVVTSFYELDKYQRREF